MTYLVTGGAGFIGFHLCKSLLDKGKKVMTVDNFSEYYDVNLKKDRLKEISKANLYIGDISDYTFMKNVFQENQIEKVIHLAAQVGVRYSIENPFEYEKSNNLGTLNIFELAKEFGIDDIVYASSSSVYGGNSNLPFSVKDEVSNQVSIYAATKRYNELIANTYNNLYGIKSIGLRFFTVYGSWGRPDMSYFKFLDKHRSGMKIKIYNNGNHLRDFTHISDIVQGIIAAINKNKNCEIYNLGNNNPLKLMDFIKKLELISGVDFQKEYLPMQKGDVHETFADIELTKKELNWEPKVEIDEGLKEFCDWYKNYFKLQNI
tara:strand:- start:238 stop:1191 length:954 start_codon:yes stop_codon:yes gene_type:complete